MINHRVLFVGGNFADLIRPSGYIAKMHACMKKFGLQVKFKNGGTFEELTLLLDDVVNYDVILWFANVPNDFDKIVSGIKTKNPHVILVTSKNNISNKYNYHEIAARMLSVKTNLCLVFTKNDSGIIEGTVIDPLLNGFTNKEPDVEAVTRAIVQRISKLLSYTRVGSIRGGDAIEVPDNNEFFEIARRYAEQFHNIIHQVNTERFLGNLSFRCESGFPSYRYGDTVFVSRRNIDKRMIGGSGFVGVSLSQSKPIIYYGDAKPSVDTPVQVALYNAYPKVNYMIHSHVYVTGAPFTNEKIPCGAFEEVMSIVNVLGYDIDNAAINLLGHGSIVFAKDLDYFNTIIYKPRPVLDFQYITKPIHANLLK